MTQQHHVIKKQIFAIEVLAEVDYLQLKGKIGDILQKLVYPKLGIICDQHSTPDIQHNISRLEIDLGKVALSDLKSVLIEQVPPKFEAVLRVALKGLSRKDPSIKQQDTEIELRAIEYFLKTGTLPWWRQNNRKSLSRMLQSLVTKAPDKIRHLLVSLNKNAWARLIFQQSDQQLLELVEIFMPPWQENITILHHELQKLIYCSSISTSLSFGKLRQHYWSFVFSFVLSKPSENNAVAFVNGLILYLMFVSGRTGHKNSVTEISRQATGLMHQREITSPSIVLWLKEVAPNKNNNLISLFSEIIKLLEEIVALPLPKQKKALTYSLLEKFKKYITPHTNFLKHFKLLLKSLSKLINSLEQVTRKETHSKVSAHSLSEKDKDHYSEKIKVQSEDPSLFVLNSKKRLDPNTPRRKAQDDDLRLNILRQKLITLTNQIQLSLPVDRSDKLQLHKSKLILIDEAIYIENAGLVVYWVYLKKLFTTLELLNQNQTQFSNKKTRIRGSLLLSLMMQDNFKNIPEYELTLNKLLCGISIEQPLPSMLRVMPIERQECARLTTTLISHWAALGKITTEDFRQSFVQRFGAIKQRDSQWLLQVEKKPHDVLLNKLPWPMHVIKLPWMKNPIVVEW